MGFRLSYQHCGHAAREKAGIGRIEIKAEGCFVIVTARSKTIQRSNPSRVASPLNSTIYRTLCCWKRAWRLRGKLDPWCAALIRHGASEVLQEFVDVDQIPNTHSVRFTEEGKKRLEAIASHGIVNPAYMPSSTSSKGVTFLTGLMDLIETGGAEGYAIRFFMLQQLILAHCAEKRTITSMVQLGLGQTAVKSSDDARNTIGALYNLLIPDVHNGSGPNPNDGRFAIAIKAPMIRSFLLNVCVTE
jgi:hypothetical protein